MDKLQLWVGVLMFKIDNELIENIAHNHDVYRRGTQYFYQNRVVSLELDEENNCLYGIVSGGERYAVSICFSPEGAITEVYCDCPAHQNYYYGACKHVVALLMKYQYHSQSLFSKQRAKIAASKLADSMLAYFDQQLSNDKKRTVKLEVTLDVEYQGKNSYAVSLRMGLDRMYVVKSIRDLFAAMEDDEPLVFGKNFVFEPLNHSFTAEDQPVIDLLHEIYELDKIMFRDSWGYYSNRSNSLFNGKHVLLGQTAAIRLLSILPSGSFNLKLFNREYKNVPVLEQDLPLEFSLNKEKEDLLLQWNKLKLCPLVKTGEYFFLEDRIVKISEQQRKVFLPLINAFIDAPRGIRLSKQQKERFVTEVLPVVKRIGQVKIDPVVKESFCEADLQVEIWLDKIGEDVTAKVEFVYDQIRFNPFAGNAAVQTGDKILIRDMEKEGAIFQLLEQAEFQNLKGLLHLRREENIYQFVYSLLPQLQQLGEIYYSEKFRKLRVRDVTAVAGRVRLNEGNDMLEFSFHLDEIDMIELNDVFASLREKKKYHRLKDGSFLPLDTDSSHLEQLMSMVDSLNISEQQLQQAVVNIPKYRAMYIDRCLREGNLRFERNLVFKQLVQNIAEPQDMEFAVPNSIKATLREYQRTGFKWLKTLAMYGLGGILADDMGLGKTLQTLTFIASERERMQLPALVVAPTSVVYNWQDEANKFAPELQVVVVSGTPQEREELLKAAKEADLVITSYALMRRDIKLYQDIGFGYCFLDEAQNIKNPNSLNAKAVKTIQAKGCFALTGTPIENSLMELWSIFDFIMPGYLLSRQEFIKKYERPIVTKQNDRVLTELQRQIAPFILRRMKKEVLQELPPKIEHKVLIDLTKEQKKVYVGYLQKAKQEIEEVIAASGFERNQIKILSVLTRLRQICCHPATFLENYHGNSGKLEYLKEFMRDALASGHRILLFSQFTSMLEIIRNQLICEGIACFYLDGSTKMEARSHMVQSFNKGEGEVFLISLKAGGTGLNLAGADMVIHYDPWWNPAVEDQATDRAYRIGQKNSVQVINLITKGTIEEKIYELQQKKKAMIDAVIKPGETMISKMTEQEIRELLS
ncbi:SNF2 helicase associated domain-containing protein [Peptococcaceae bacterium 1198_IL3148]